MFSLFRRLGLIFPVVLLMLAVSGCAGLEPSTPEAQVSARAQQRWKALMAGEWSKVHNFLTPAFASTMPAERYRERFVGVPRWLDALVQSAKCDGGKCTVVVRVVAEYRGRSGMDTLSTDVPEIWILEDGQWYKYESM